MAYVGLGGKNNKDEPATPITKISTHPKHNHVILCAIGFKNPIDVSSFKNELSKSIMLKIPRFSSLFIHHNGEELWKKTNVNLDDHIFIHHPHDDHHHHDYHNDDDHYHDHHDDNHNNHHHDDHETAMSSDEDAINSYLADIAVSPPMSLDKPLWEIHIMNDHKCMIFRVHHAVSDGMSLMSLLWTLGNSSTTKRVNNNHYIYTHDLVIKSSKNKDDHTLRRAKRISFSTKLRLLWENLMIFWLSLVSLVKALARCLWVKDKETVISGIEGVELWPRKVTTAKFKISDMKTIKKAIPNATINDVLYGILWCGLTRYLKIRHPQALEDGTQFTGICPINLREQAGVEDVARMLSKNSKAPWGNKFAMTLIPITYFESDFDALSYVAQAKAIMDRKKQSMEARLCYLIASLTFKWFGSKVGGDLYYRFFNNTSFLVSNMSGPQEKISIAHNPVTFMRVTSSSQPHAITLHMVSYAGNADLQIQVAKDVITDPQFLATCLQDALLEMKEASEKWILKKI